MKSFNEYITEAVDAEVYGKYKYNYSSRTNTSDRWTPNHIGDFYVGPLEDYLRKHKLPIVDNSVKNSESINVTRALDYIFRNCKITNPDGYRKALQAADSRIDVDSVDSIDGRIFIYINGRYGVQEKLTIKNK